MIFVDFNLIQVILYELILTLFSIFLVEINFSSDCSQAKLLLSDMYK